MTDIFARKPLPRDRAPAPKYNLFVEEMERQLAEQRKAWAEMERAERLYNCVREVLTGLRLPHEQTLRVTRRGVAWSVKALPTDRQRDLAAWMAALAAGLHKAGLRGHAEPNNLTHNEHSSTLFATYACGNDLKRVLEVQVHIPDRGIADLKYKLCRRTTEEYFYAWADLRGDAQLPRVPTDDPDPELAPADPIGDF